MNATRISTAAWQSALALLVFTHSSLGQPPSVAISLRGTWPGPAPLQGKRVYGADITLVGQYGYLAMGRAGLVVLDMSDLSNPKRIGGWDNEGQAEAVFVTNGLAFLADGEVGLTILSITNPVAPVLIGELGGIGYATDIHIQGGYAYVSSASGMPGLHIINVINPWNPVAVGRYPTPAAFCVFTSGSRAFVGHTDLRWEIIDVSNPQNPTRLGGGDGPMVVSDIQVIGETAYVMSGGLRIYDISIPASPREVGTWLGGGQKVAIEGHYAYVVADPNFVILDISDATQPVATYNTFPSGSFLNSFGIKVKGDFAYIARAEGLTILDVSNRNSPTWLSDFKVGRFIKDVAIRENRLFAAADYGLLVFDISDEVNPRVIASYGTNWGERALQIVHTNAFLIGDQGLEILDISTPQPVRLGFNSPDLFGRDIKVIENTAFLTAGSAGLVVVDITDRTRPVRVGAATNLVFGSPRGAAARLDISGGYAYVAYEEGSLVIFDVADRESPTKISAVSFLNESATAVSAAANLVWIGKNRGGLELFDVSNPAAPRSLAKSGYMSEEVTDLKTAGAFVFVTTINPLSLQVYVRTNGTNLIGAGSYLGAGGHRMQLLGSRIYIANDELSIFQVDGIKYTQLIDFPPLRDRLIIESPFNVVAAASSGLPVEFRLLSGPATITNDLVTLTNTGAVTIEASQPGNTNYLPASSVQRSFTVTRPFYDLVVLATNGSVSVSPPRSRFALGEQVTLTATPASNFLFLGWSGSVTGNANPLIITMDTNKSIRAVFALPVLNIQVDGMGKVMSDPVKAFYNLGEQVELRAVPGRWFEFAGWADGPIANPRTITISTNNTYTAIFSPTTVVETLTFSNVTRTAPVGMPAVFVDGEFVTNDVVARLGQAEVSMLTTFPNGSIFYTLDGSAPSLGAQLYSGSFAQRRSAIIRAIAYDANFTKSWEADPINLTIEPTYVVDASTLGGGSITLMPAGSSYRSNTVVNLIATPASGWEFLQWLGDVSGTDPTNSVIVTRVMS